MSVWKSVTGVKFDKVEIESVCDGANNVDVNVFVNQNVNADV